MSIAVLQSLIQDEYNASAPGPGELPPGVIDEANDPWGEAMGAILRIRLNDGAGGAPGTAIFPIEVGLESVVAVNPITRQRDIEFGVAAAGVWMVQITSATGYMLDYDVRGCWAVLIGYLSGENVAYAQGKISRVSYNTDGTITFEIQDSMMDMLNYQLPRDLRYQSTGWLSEMKVLYKAAASKTYDSAFLIALNPIGLVDETFLIEFTSPTAYKVILEDGDETQTGSTTTSPLIKNVGASNVIMIQSGGWNTGASAYATGDQFVLYTSEARTAAILTPINIVIDLMDSVMGLTGYDVIAGAAYPTVRFDTDQWALKAADFNDFSLYGVNGTWVKGSTVSSMISGLMKIIHGAIYPSRDGRIGLWVLDAGSEISAVLNGNPVVNPVGISSARAEQDMRDVVSEVTYKYKALGGGDTSDTATADDFRWSEARAKTFDLKWEVVPLAISSALSIYINRFRDGVKKYYIDATMAGLTAEIGTGVVIIEDVINEPLAQADVVALSLDIMNNSTQVVAYTEPTSLVAYAKIGESEIAGPEVVW